MATVNLTIDGNKVQAEAGKTILQVSRENGLNIPAFCNQPFLEPKASCRMCVVEVKGARSLVTACSTPVGEGMEIKTHSDRVDTSRRVILELLLANHATYCPTCHAREKCLLLKYSRRYGVEKVHYFGKKRETEACSDFDSIIERDQAKCILCGKCVEVCRQVIGVEAIDFKNRGFKTQIGTAFDKKLKDTRCINCGQCVNGCPTGAIYVRSDVAAVQKELRDPTRKVIFQTAPSIRAAIGEEFGIPAGTITTGKMVTALRRLGAHKVYQTDFGADLTIMEEGHEFIRRFTANDKIPMFTSCCPAWQKYIEEFYPDLLPNLSSCKSPHQMTGAVIKHHYAEKMGLTKEEVTVVSIMPCSAKKWEITRPGCCTKELADVDYVLTTREFADIIKAQNIDFAKLPDEEFDSVVGQSTGAGEMFAVTGGVMEAALRTVAVKVLKRPLEKVDFMAVRGMKRVKEATIDLDGTKVNILVVSGLANAKPFLDDIRAGKSKYHFIEVMNCPAGCINGGGMPFYEDFAVIQKRYDAIIGDDKGHPIRSSHENPAILELYTDWLKEPNGEMAHHYLHTPYIDRSDVI